MYMAYTELPEAAAPASERKRHAYVPYRIGTGFIILEGDR